MINIHELMSTQLYTLHLEQTLHDAHELMDGHKIRHIPVIDDDGKFLGLLTQRDLLAMSISTFADISNQERDELETGIPLVEAMTRDVVVADESTSLLDAARYMLDSKHGCLPVVEGDGVLKGIITEADFVKLTLHLLEKMGAQEEEE